MQLTPAQRAVLVPASAGLASYEIAYNFSYSTSPLVAAGISAVAAWIAQRYLDPESKKTVEDGLLAIGSGTALHMAGDRLFERTKGNRGGTKDRVLEGASVVTALLTFRELRKPDLPTVGMLPRYQG